MDGADSQAAPDMVPNNNGVAADTVDTAASQVCGQVFGVRRFVLTGQIKVGIGWVGERVRGRGSRENLKFCSAFEAFGTVGLLECQQRWYSSSRQMVGTDLRMGGKKRPISFKIDWEAANLY